MIICSLVTSNWDLYITINTHTCTHTRTYIHKQANTNTQTVYGKTFEGENFRGFRYTAKIFPCMFCMLVAPIHYSDEKMALTS